ncbi:hypothetical protein K438DRAFT_1868258 [Mycena galopus ATCC 62051]|nr:hypothetical protein K438DRAFT_1868258 [Mycena galopus ATCC 62051]
MKGAVLAQARKWGGRVQTSRRSPLPFSPHLPLDEPFLLTTRPGISTQLLLHLRKQAQDTIIALSEEKNMDSRMRNDAVNRRRTGREIFIIGEDDDAEALTTPRTSQEDYSRPTVCARPRALDPVPRIVDFRLPVDGRPPLPLSSPLLSSSLRLSISPTRPLRVSQLAPSSDKPKNTDTLAKIHLSYTYVPVKLEKRKKNGILNFSE